MELFETSDFLIWDNFLSKENFEFLWAQFNTEEFKFVHTEKWIKAWRICDGEPLGGQVYISHKSKIENSSIVYPAGNAFDILISQIIENKQLFEKYVGKFGIDWSYFYCKPYIYPVNTGLSWHQDRHDYISGAYTFYCHKTWKPSWGGELLIGHKNTQNFIPLTHKMYNQNEEVIGLHIDNNHIVDKVMAEGYGSFILPKPNRLVLIKKGLLHSIKKVDSSAGENLRMTIQGFFMNP